MRAPIRAAALTAALAIVLAAPEAAASSIRYHWPVQPPLVTRSYTVGLEDWDPGHRGIDLAAADGTPVGAAASGEVLFAGTVSGVTWATVRHIDGVLTTLGPLADLRVEVGDRVHGGTLLGVAAPGPGHHGVHFSARRDGAYIDPRTLLRGILVPRLVGGGSWEASRLHELPGYQPWDGRDRTLGLLPGTRGATAPGWISAPNGNDVISVAGLLTHTGATALPLEFLGYAPEAITELSHAGRSDAGGLRRDDPRRDQLPYDRADTFGGVQRSALLLKQQLQAQWARNPGVAVDLVGHSFGGVVVLHYLMALHDPADPTLPPIGHAVTIAAPLEGADGINAINDPGGPDVLKAAADLAASRMGVGPDPATLEDLAVGSPLLQRLAASWFAAGQDVYASPLASGTRVLTIGGSRDVVVPEHRSDLPGAEHVTLPGGHTAVRTTEAVLQVTRAFLSDQEVPASAGGLGSLFSPAVSLAERLVGVLL